MPIDAQLSDRDIVMATRPVEEPSPSHWVVQFTDCSAFAISDSLAENEVVAEAERQHRELGLTGRFGYACHVPSGKMIDALPVK